MDYLRLLTALLLPWLGGYFWLTVLERRLNPGPTSTLHRIGYGFFIGYAGMQGIILSGNVLTGSVSFWPLLTAAALLTACGAVLLAFSHSRTRGVDTELTPVLLSPPLARALFWVTISWTTLHLLLVATEILHRPVFPWDAWLNWMYRAKAWFYAGSVIDMAHPTEWLRGIGSATYNVEGNHYPSFSPVLALWAATALGRWSETLVNLPTLFCGLALGLAMYGQCREYGLEKWLSALCVYLLLSLPLVDTHLSLAGQADIWMSGFTGLGFVALLHGSIRGKQSQIMLGLGMIAMGIATKAEGAVWMLAALLTLALARHTAITMAGLALVAAIAALGWLFGVTYLELPLLGGMGLADGRVHIPLLGSYALQTFDLWDDYQKNFFENGTWHLLWTFLLIGVFSLWFVSAGTLRRTLVAFYAVLLVAQLFIFEGTESGQWAEDWTAINRLPLHFTPPLVFSLVVLVHAFLTRQNSTANSQAVIRAPLAGLLLTLALAMTYLLLAYPGDGGTARSFTGHDMRIVVGSGRLAGDTGLIEHYENNIAILSSGPVQLEAKQLGLLRVKTAGPNQNRANFFWRNGDGPDNLHYTEIPGRGTRWINLHNLPLWQGQLTEIGLIFYSDRGKAVEFHELELAPQALPLQLSLLAHDWRATSRWSQKSAHWLATGAETGTISLPLLLSAWTVIAMLATISIARQTPGVYIGMLLCATLAWAVLDLRWTNSSLAQARATIQIYPLLTSESLRDFGNDEITRELVDASRPYIEQAQKRTVIMAEDPGMRFQMLRAKYHALPAVTYVHEGPASQVPAQVADHVLVLKKLYSEPGYSHPTPEDYSMLLTARTGLQVTVEWETTEGILLSLAPGTAP